MPNSAPLPNGLDFALSVPRCPVTAKRTPAVDADHHIEKPSIARANVAVSTAVPYGRSEHAKKYQDYTVLQQHVLFWDRDGDGVIYPWDTYTGFRDLGFNMLMSLLAMLVINLNFSYLTRMPYSYIPDPLFRVYVDNIYKAKHGSDTGVYDTEGRFVPQKFEDLFEKWDKDHDGALELRELFDLMHGNRCAMDPFGWFAAFFEFGTTWLLIQKGGRIYKEDLRQVYDGSIFYRIRDRRRSGKGWQQGWGIGGDGFIGELKTDGA